MRCPRCHAENPAGMKFCGHCGAPVGLACPSCGADNPAEHRFCGQCGAALDGSGRQNIMSTSLAPEPGPQRAAHAERVLSGEIKQVTVLFCDIVGSTPLTDRLGSEGMRDLVSSFLDTSLAEVHRYGGTAPQFLGDGFMAVFGAPVTQEDHVRRALLAAAAIQRALGGGGDPADIDRLDLPVRIGINTGPVVFGPVGGDLAMKPTAIGDTANVAARLQQAAEPRTILLSEATRRLAQDYARVEPFGPLAIKGKAEPTPAYRLLAVSHRRSGLREFSPGRAAVFVDRESELAILNNFLHQVENGRSQAVGVVGEPGIGKSRLLAEFHRQLGDRRVTWVEGRCVSYGTTIPYWLLLDLLRSNCGIVETDTPVVITEKVRSGLQEIGIDPEQDSRVLLHLLGVDDIGGSTGLSNPEAVKAKAFEIFRQIGVKGSRLRPLVLVLEDLHWVDKMSEEFLGFLAENAPDARILMLATHRPGYRPPWIDKSYAGQTPLQPLSRDDSLQMVRQVLSAERLVDLVSEEIVAKADGNPFFIEQLALHARDLRSDLMVPNTIHDVVTARIDRLPEETKRLLQTAAVLGREFSFRLLSAVCDGSGPLEAQLRELTRLEFIYERVEAEGTTYVFRHALTQEVAYGTLLERHRRTWHGVIGHALEQLYTDRTQEVAELLALHFGRSDDSEKAVDYAILAAEKAQRRWANDEALTCFNEALRRLNAMPDTKPNRLRRVDAILKQAEPMFALGLHTEHIQALEDIRQIVEETNDPRRRATWYYETGFLHSLAGARPDMAIEYCREAAKIASSAGLDEINNFAESCLAQIYIIAGRPRDALQVGERAVNSFESRGDLWWAGLTLWHLSSAANYLGEWEASRRYSRRAFEHGDAINDSRLKAVSRWRMGVAYILQGDFDRGQQCCIEAIAIAPNPRDAAMARAAHGYAEIKRGRVDAGIAELNEAVTRFKNSHLHFTYLNYALWLAEGHLLQGNRGSARSLIEDVLNTSRKTGYLHFEGRACWLMGDCLAAEEPASAEAYAETAMCILERVGARNDLAKAMVTRAALRQGAGDIETARLLLDQARKTFHLLGTRGEFGRVEAAIDALGRGSPIRLFADAS